MAILIIGQSADPHVSSVTKILAQQGVRHHVIDCYGPSHLHFEYSPAPAITVDGQTITANDIDLVWWRLKPPLDQSKLPEFEDLQEEAHWKAQWRAALESIEYIFAGAATINGHQARRVGSFKAVQLVAASEAGFEIPQTCISNDPSKLTSPFPDGVFFKSLSAVPYYRHSINYTHIFEHKELTNLAESIRVNPAIYQEIIAKKYELRVCVFGSDIHAYKIDSQKNKKTQTDWRMAIDDSMFEEIEFESENAEKCHAFMQKMQLDCGIFDFAVKGDGELVFFEVNVDGQWFWLDRLFNGVLSKSFAQMIFHKIESVR